jgi:hypothetical protein
MRTDLLSSCCSKPLTWALERYMVGPYGKPVAYCALCTGCKKLVACLPMEGAGRVRLNLKTCYCGNPRDPDRIHTSDVPCYNLPKTT